MLSYLPVVVGDVTFWFLLLPQVQTHSHSTTIARVQKGLSPGAGVGGMESARRSEIVRHQADEVSVIMS